jgi:hypothetical protein
MKYFVILFSLLSFVVAQNKALAVVIKAKGKVLIERPGGKKEKVKRGSRIYHNDMLKTMKKARVAFRFLDDRSLVRMRENSLFKIQGKNENGSVSKNIQMEVGSAFFSIAKQKGRFRVSTPTSVASVKGTKFECFYDNKSGEHVTATHEGLVGVRVGEKEIDIKEGRLIIAKKDRTFKERKMTESDKKKFGIQGDKNDEDDLLEIKFKSSEGSKNMKIKISDK